MCALATGTINPDTRTFDILGVNETNTSISVNNGSLRLAYTSPEGKFVQLVKNLDTDDGVQVGDSIGLSPALDQGVGGYAQKTKKDPVAIALTSINWDDTSKFSTRTFVDQNGVSRIAVLMPVIIRR